jgi:vitamin B12 transporter
MKKIFFVVAAIMIGSQLIAQLVPTLREEDTIAKTMDEVVVTANKFAQKQSTTGKVVTVITKEQLEKSSGKTLMEVLNEQAVLRLPEFTIPREVFKLF